MTTLAITYGDREVLPSIPYDRQVQYFGATLLGLGFDVQTAPRLDETLFQILFAVLFAKLGECSFGESFPD